MCGDASPAGAAPAARRVPARRGSLVRHGCLAHLPSRYVRQHHAIVASQFFEGSRHLTWTTHLHLDAFLFHRLHQHLGFCRFPLAEQKSQPAAHFDDGQGIVVPWQ